VDDEDAVELGSRIVLALDDLEWVQGIGSHGERPIFAGSCSERCQSIFPGDLAVEYGPGSAIKQCKTASKMNKQQ
jgi:hypothetical protein